MKVKPDKPAALEAGRYGAVGVMESAIDNI
jgi:hypothetical protein